MTMRKAAATRTPATDSQVHAYELNRPQRPRSGYLQGPNEVTSDDIDAVGVDGALPVSPFAMYRNDASATVSVSISSIPTEKIQAM